MWRLAVAVMLYLTLGTALPVLGEVDSPPEQGEATSTMVAVPRVEWEELKTKLEALEREVEALKAGQAPAAEVPAEAVPAVEVVPALETPAQAGGRYLALPDISFIVQAKGLASTDHRDEFRDQIRISEAEIGIQGWVYPNVKADAALTASPAEGASFGVEEAYLTYLSLCPSLNAYVGKKHVAFGRTNLLHSHSWPYVRQPAPIRNLVAEESLIGEGAAIAYVLPTQGDLFAQIDLGTWTASAGHVHAHEEEEEEEEHDHMLEPPGAGFVDGLNTARLWASKPMGECGEVEVGGSYASGPSHGFSLGRPSRATLTGVDLSFRHFGEGERRLLLRGEKFWRREEEGPDSSTASGYYLFSQYRNSRYDSLGLLYDWSEFPQDPELHEDSLSLIYTHQFNEQYYLRLQGTHGSRPGDNSYNELWAQWCWGIGPHTHNLE
jgi:hypothetical protein